MGPGETEPIEMLVFGHPSLWPKTNIYHGAKKPGPIRKYNLVIEFHKRKYIHMPFINDRDAAVFREASIPAIDNFTEAEFTEIGELAQRLRVILEAAKERQQKDLRRIGWS
jgi:hypothetical protein